MQESEVFARVRDCFVEALGVEPEEVQLGAKVIDDLGAESLDLLDIVYRLERAFDIKIPRGNIENQARQTTPGEYEVDGVLTALALARLQAVMPEVPAADFRPGLTVKDIPRLFVVATFHNLVLKLLQEKGTPVEGTAAAVAG